MIVRTLQAAEQTDRRVVGPTWESTRLLLKHDTGSYPLPVD